MTRTQDIAKSIGIAPRTKRFEITDEYGFGLGGGRTQSVLDALGRSDLSEMDQRTRTMAMGIRKAYATGRMNLELARHLRERLSPYQVVGFLVAAAALYQGEPTIGHVADIWLNQHATELVASR